MNQPNLPPDKDAHADPLPFDPKRLMALVGLLRENALEAEDFDELNAILASHPSASAWYAEAMWLCTHFNTHGAGRLPLANANTTPSLADNDAIDPAMWMGALQDALEAKDAQLIEAGNQLAGGELASKLPSKPTKQPSNTKTKDAPSGGSGGGVIFSFGGVHVHRSQNGQGIRLSHALAAAALLIVGVTVAVVAKDRPVKPTQTLVQSVPVEATMQWGLDAQWREDGRRIERANGATLAAGRHELLNGFATIRLDSGVDVLLTAPCLFEINKPNELRLLQGALTADVPKPATGFIVHAGQSQITDLGTQFGVDLKETGEALAAVFKGSVALAAQPATTASNNDANNPSQTNQSAPVLLKAGFEMGIDRRGRVTAAAPKPTTHRFIRTWHEAAYRVSNVQGGLDARDDAPVSVDYDALPSNRAVCFLEQASVHVSETLPGVVTDTGLFTGKDLLEASGQLEAGQTLDSYLIHYDPLSNKKPQPVSFSVTFPRKVVGVVTTPEGLLASQRWLTNAPTHLPNPAAHPKRAGIGLESGEKLPTADVLSISEDGRTLRAKLHAGMSMDQIRVFIEPASTEPVNDKQNASLDDASNQNPVATPLATPVKASAKPNGLQTTPSS